MEERDLIRSELIIPPCSLGVRMGVSTYLLDVKMKWWILACTGISTWHSSQWPVYSDGWDNFKQCKTRRICYYVWVWKWRYLNKFVLNYISNSLRKTLCTMYSVKIGHREHSMLQLERPMNERVVGKLSSLIERIIRNTLVPCVGNTYILQCQTWWYIY
jgi:hypothetical protein